MSRSGSRKQHRKGTTQYYVATLVADQDGETLVYTGDETITATLYAGNASDSLATLTADWKTAPNEIRIRVQSSDVSSLVAGWYRVVCTIESAEVAVLDLDLVDGAVDDAATLATYCTAADMRRFAPWIDRHANLTSGRSGFEFERNLALQELQSLILSAVRLGIEDETLVNTDDEDAYEITEAEVQARLDDETMLVTDVIRDWCAYHALWLVLSSAHGAQVATSPQRMAAEFLRRRNGLSLRLRCVIADRDDPDDDGYGTLVIRPVTLG